MAFFVEYPEVANAIGDGYVTAPMYTAIREEVTAEDTAAALVALLHHVGYRRVCIRAEDENGVGFVLDDAEETVFLDIGRDVLESDDIASYLAFIPNHVAALLDETTTSDDSEIENENEEDVSCNAPVP